MQSSQPQQYSNQPPPYGQQPGVPPLGPPKARPKWPIAIAAVLVVGVVIAVLVYQLPSISPSPSIRDTDGDGIPDAQDAFPQDRTQWADRDHDGHGDNAAGFDPDAFPDDPTEWRDLDSDGTGDNKDIYDSGNGGVRAAVSSLAVAQNCDAFSPCDPFFILGVDANGDGTYECSRTSREYTDINVLTNPSDAFVVCDIPEGSQTIKVRLQVYDNDALNAPEAIDYVPESTGAWYIYTIATPFSETQSESGDGSNGYAATLSWGIQVVAV